MLEIAGLTIAVAERDILRGLSLSLDDGKFTCLIGPSGCGKSTVLRWLAGVLPDTLAASGRLTLDGAAAEAPHPAITYQPQTDALFPWLTVAENAALGLEVAGVPRREAVARVTPMLAPFGLEGTAGLFPDALSGGMRQRAAFLRTIARGGRWLLLDEPFSALDAVTRIRMQRWLCDRLAAEPRGVLMVTHDLHEATALADRILVMAGPPGRIVADIAVPGPRATRGEADLAPLHETLKSLLLEEEDR
ncbi:ATP-binding cassette domain-containing protein [Paracoccus sp. S-4012]|uniref:ABC transporter ATP-binding protein n=1 Tax=Paracoccus sp. S-4012 TaxID=2665648 RepID=UPI0012B10F6B|nr:ABC transporter ATP-binding protein [Paracoccus sp. S-4012]MRX52098.1 ATP-binding cassette domain-containing protein [Paracoccus sp. S-4012]